MQLFLSHSFNIKTLRKTPKSAAQKVKEWKEKLHSHQMLKLEKILSVYIPQYLFDKFYKENNLRRRVYSLENTFWGFFLQTLQSDSSCQSIVHQFRVISSKKNEKELSASTSAYCQARKRFPSNLLEDIFKQTTQKNTSNHPLVDRRVVCADGTGLLASDTKENQQTWPQQANQKEGCGFPQLKLCGLFNLHTGLALSYRLGNKRSHELPLLRDQEEYFKQGDIFVGDKGFICYYDQARLLGQGVDSIVALCKRKPVSSKHAVQCIKEDDLIIRVPKFTSATARSRYPENAWEALPDELLMRQIKVNISVPGYRTQSVYLLTTLLDEKKYPARIISELYKQRWRVELYFRDLKTTLGMEMLKSKTPELVEKEIQMYFIVYNIIRLLMVDTEKEISPDDISFKSCTQTLLVFHQSIDSNTTEKEHILHAELLNNIGKCILFKRPERVEPRQVKRRPKPFKLMTKPRSVLREELMRNAA